MQSGATGSVRINSMAVVHAALFVRNVVQAMQELGLSLGAYQALVRGGRSGAGAPNASSGVRRSNGDLLITTAPSGVVMINDVDILATLRGVDPTSAP